MTPFCFAYRAYWPVIHRLICSFVFMPHKALNRGLHTNFAHIGVFLFFIAYIHCVGLLLFYHNKVRFNWIYTINSHPCRMLD